MSHLELSLLGSPVLRRDGRPLDVKPAKAFALLIYLVRQGAQTRDTLATLLWPEDGQRDARAALRRRLSELGQSLGAGWLEVGRERVALTGIQLDVARFTAHLADCREHHHDDDTECATCLSKLRVAVDLYRDDFLAGFSLAGSPAFDDWQFFQAEELRDELAWALERLVCIYRAQNKLAAALPFARRRLALDPLHEPSHRTLMELYAQAGMVSAALRQYTVCADMLRAELDVEPEKETTQLREAIQRKTFPSVTMPEASRPIAPERPAARPDDDEVRVVTVLCVDLGLSVEEAWDAQTAAVAEAATKLLAVAPETLAAYGAQVSRHLGNGFHALFGAAQVHEDDAERAIRAALGLRQSAQQAGLKMVVGINTGAAYLSHIGEDVIATGPVVTVATRLQSIAGSGDILVGEATYRQTAGAFEYTNVTDIPIRHRAYRLEQPRPLARKTRGIEGLVAPLVGRQTELATLTKALMLAQGGRGQVALLVGEAGVGKSRLVAELHSQVQDVPDICWLEGRCLELSEQTAYAPWIDLFHGYFGWSWQDAPETRARQLATAVEEMIAQEEVAEEVAEFMGAALGNLLDVRFGTAWDTYLEMATPQQIHYQTLEALGAFFAALTYRGPLALVLEDLHWADALSLDLVVWLLTHLARIPLLLLAVYRPYPDHRSAQLAALAGDKCPDALTEVSLRQLTPIQSRVLVAGLLDEAALPEPAVASILAQGQGNPFFLEEVVYGLIDTGALQRDNGVWQVASASTQPVVSPSVQSVVLDRVDRLSQIGKQVLQHAAVMGRLVPKWLLQGLDPGLDLDATLPELMQRAFLIQEQAVPEPLYVFRHVLVQEAIYQITPPSRRAALHRQVAELLEAAPERGLGDRVELIAYHFERGREVDKAVEYLVQAGDKARRAYLNSAAVDYYSRALEFLAASGVDNTVHADQRTQWRMAALTGLGEVHGRSGVYVEAERCFHQAIALGRELGLPARRLALFASWRAELLNWQNLTEQSIQASQEALSWLGPDDVESQEAALLHAALAWSYLHEHQTTPYLRELEQLAPFVDRLPYAAGLRSAYTAIWALHFMQKHEPELVAWMQTYKNIATSHRDRWAQGEAVSLGGVVDQARGDFTHALACYNEADRLFREVGDAARSDWYGIRYGAAALTLGDLATAERLFLDARGPVQARGTDIWTAPLLAFLGITCLAHGDWDGAAGYFTDPTLERNHPREASIWLARTLLATGDRASAVDSLGRGFAIMTREDLAPRFRTAFMPYWRPILADALSALEVALSDPAVFAAYCRQYQADHPDLASGPFSQWYLTEATPDPRFPGAVLAELSAPSILTMEGLEWRDPTEECAYQVQDDGLVIFAANGRDLWYMNRTAPRWVSPVQGNFAVQTVCRPACADRPGMGGLLLWRDDEHYLRLGIGIRGQDEVSLEGCMDNHDWVFGRGRLVTDRVWLRLERVGTHVRALCRAQTGPWYLVGETMFPDHAAVEAGLHAIGDIDRSIHHGTYPDGTALHFGGWWVWQ